MIRIKSGIKKVLFKYKKLPTELKATFWFLICSIIQKSISLVTVPIFTRLLSVEEYGIYISYLTWLDIFMVFTTFKLNFGVFNKGMTKYKDEKDEYVSTMQVITSFLTIVFLFVYIFFRKQFNQLTELSTWIILLMFIEMFFYPAISFWILRERYELKYIKVVLVTILMAVANPFLGILAVLYSKSPAYARIVSCIFINAAFGVCIYIHNFKKSKKIYVSKIAKFAVIFNLPLVPHYISEYILDQSDRVMIQKMCTKVDLGFYSVSYSAASAIRIIVGSLNSALIPWLYRNIDEKQYDRVRRITNISFIIIGIPILLFILFAPEVLYILAPVEYYDAKYVIPPVAGSVFYIFCFGVLGNIEFYFDKNKFTMYVSSISAILNLILNYFGIKSFGYIAAAYSTLICYFVLAVSHSVFTEYICRKKTNSKIIDIRFICIISLVMNASIIICSFFYSNSFIRYIILVISMIVIWLNKKRVNIFFVELKER